MATFGGVVAFKYAGNPLVMRGHVTISPSSVDATAVPNQDGSISRTLTPMGYRAKCKFEDSQNTAAGLSQPTPQPWDAILKGGPVNITIIEQQTNVTHMWTNGQFFGKVTVDREKGEVDGLEWVSPVYSTTTAG